MVRLDDHWVYCLKVSEGARRAHRAIDRIDVVKPAGQHSVSTDELGKNSESTLQQAICVVLREMLPGTEVSQRVVHSACCVESPLSPDVCAPNDCSQPVATSSSGQMEMGTAGVSRRATAHAGYQVVLLLLDGKTISGRNMADRKRLEDLTSVGFGETASLFVLATPDPRLNIEVLHQFTSETGGHLVCMRDAPARLDCMSDVVSTICTMVNTRLCVDISSTSAMEVVAPGIDASHRQKNFTTTVGILTAGSFQTVICRIPCDTHAAPAKVCFKVEKQEFEANEVEADTESVAFVVAEYARHRAVTTLCTIAPRTFDIASRKHCQMLLNEQAVELSLYSERFPQSTTVHTLKRAWGELETAAESTHIASWGRACIFTALSQHWNRITADVRGADSKTYSDSKAAVVRSRVCNLFTKAVHSILTGPPPIRRQNAFRLVGAPYSAFSNTSSCVV